MDSGVHSGVDSGFDSGSDSGWTLGSILWWIPGSILWWIPGSILGGFWDGSGGGMGLQEAKSMIHSSISSFKSQKA